VTDRLEALIENTIGRTLTDAGWHVPLSVRGLAAQAVMATIREHDEPDPAAVYGGDLTSPLCCCKRGLMCGACGTGHHWECPDRDDGDYDAHDGEEDEDDERSR
jgi:hypothetical protein